MIRRKNVYLWCFLVTVAMLTMPAAAVDYTWIGGTSGSAAWDDPGNWDPCGVPDTTSEDPDACDVLTGDRNISTPSSTTDVGKFKWVALGGYEDRLTLGADFSTTGSYQIGWYNTSRDSSKMALDLNSNTFSTSTNWWMVPDITVEGPGTFLGGVGGIEFSAVPNSSDPGDWTTPVFESTVTLKVKGSFKAHGRTIPNLTSSADLTLAAGGLTVTGDLTVNHRVNFAVGTYLVKGDLNVKAGDIDAGLYTDSGVTAGMSLEGNITDTNTEQNGRYNSGRLIFVGGGNEQTLDIRRQSDMRLVVDPCSHVVLGSDYYAPYDGTYYWISRVRQAAILDVGRHELTLSDLDAEWLGDYDEAPTFKYQAGSSRGAITIIGDLATDPLTAGLNLARFKVEITDGGGWVVADDFILFEYDVQGSYHTVDPCLVSISLPPDWVYKGLVHNDIEKIIYLEELADATIDTDGDGVGDIYDLCPNTPGGTQVNVDGCPDADGDGVADASDLCPASPPGSQVSFDGCPDADGDGIKDSDDLCPGTEPGTQVSLDGCPDADGDNVRDSDDLCPVTMPGYAVDANGCIVIPQFSPDACPEVIALGYRLGGDFDGSCHVTLGDLVAFMELWLADCFADDCSAVDIDDSMTVDLVDFAGYSANLGRCNQPYTPGCSSNWSIEAGPFTLVSGGANPANIVINSTDQTILDAADDLAEKLQAISGATFVVTSSSNGSRGIALGVPGDFDYLPPGTLDFGDGGDPCMTLPEFLREQYIIHSTNDGVCLIGKTPLAVQHAVWDLLYHFGYRQYFPRARWEHVPSNDTLTIDIDIAETPDYRARDTFYNGVGPHLQIPEWDLVTPYEEWRTRNRMAKGFTLNCGHSYQAIVARNASTFAANPDYWALLDGVRQVGIAHPKFCVDNQGLRDFIGPDAVAQMGAEIDLDSISREPSDGYGWCKCDGDNPDGTTTNCVGNYASISDRALTISNLAAQALVDAGYTDKYVGMCAYNMHSNPPVDTMVHPRVFVNATTGYTSGEYTYEEILKGWRDMGAALAVYDYFSEYQWDFNKPRKATAAYPRDLAADMRNYYNWGARLYSAESTASWGAHGLGFYVANRVMWDINEADNVENIIDEFITNMFGPAASEMTVFYDFINKDKLLRSDDNVLANMYKYLDEAVTAASGDSAVLGRIYDLIKYTRFYELHAIYESDNTNQSYIDALLTFTYRLRLDGLVHAFRVWTVFQLFDEGLYDPDYYLKDANEVDEAEVLSILAAGRSTFGDPPDPYPSFADEFVVYSEDLVPAAAPMGLTHPAGAGQFPGISMTRHHFWLWVDPCQTTITFDVATSSYGGMTPFPTMSLYHLDNGPDPIETLSWSAAEVSVPHRLTFNTPYTGLHQAVVYDAGRNQSHVDWDPSGVSDSNTALVTVPSGLEQDYNYDRLILYWLGYWRAFFYVPPGTTTIGFWANAPAGEVYDGNSQRVALYPGTGDPDGWYAVTVPPGQDGKVWSMVSWRGMRLLTTVPPYFAETVDNLLLPREVVYGVSPGAATNPSPGDSTSGIDVNADLSWTVGSATATQELYFGTNNPPAHAATLSGTDNSYDPGPLSGDTTYHWRIDAENINGVTSGTTWSFTTGSAP